MADGDNDKPQVTQSSNSNEPSSPLDMRWRNPLATGAPALGPSTPNPLPGGQKYVPNLAQGGSRPTEPSPTVHEAVQRASRTSAERDAVRDKAPEPVDKPTINDHAVNDHAVLGLCEILALMFGLPPGEALFRGEPLSLRLVGFIVAGAFFAALGPGWPVVRKKFPQQALVLSIGRIASDARYWLAIILIGFLYAASPEMYRRATTPIAVIGAIGSMPIGEVTPDEQIKQATKVIAAERDEAIKSAARAAKERDDALLALQRKEEALTTQPSPVESPTAQKGPIVWNLPEGQQLFVVGADASGYIVGGALFWGESTESVSITEAYAISGMTGHKQDLKANVPNKGYFAVDKVDIPPGAPVHLDLAWNPPIPPKDFLNQWGKFHVVIKYNGIKFERDYDEALVRQKLQQQAPDMFGPQMTPRDDK